MARRISREQHLRGIFAGASAPDTEPCGCLRQGRDDGDGWHRDGCPAREIELDQPSRRPNPLIPQVDVTLKVTYQQSRLLWCLVMGEPLTEAEVREAAEIRWEIEAAQAEATSS